jgi:hypothetical protein
LDWWRKIAIGQEESYNPKAGIGISVSNVRTALSGYPVRAVFGWLDSLVALHWIKGGRTYKQFVSYRVRKINEKDFIMWRHVGTDYNPADRGSEDVK